MDNHQYFLQNKFKQTAKLIPPKSKVLDIGCNNGNLRNFIPTCEYYATDIDSNHINNLIKQGINAETADLNTQELPFKNEKFDYVLLLDILEHVLNPKKLIQESKQRLNHNGKIIITLPNDYHLLNKLRFLINKPLTEDPFAPYGHLHFFSIKTGEKFLINNNLKILKKIPIAPAKPDFLPQSIKNFLGKSFPQGFARDVLYLLGV